jgi:NADPH-dependent 2,4-dienoyl-CoA reductase/sulfur reductase-like enzyme
MRPHRVFPRQSALAAARYGLRVILNEDTDWIGGQSTSQTVPPDENAHLETHGATIPTAAPTP